MVRKAKVASHILPRPKAGYPVIGHYLCTVYCGVYTAVPGKEAVKREGADARVVCVLYERIHHN